MCIICIDLFSFANGLYRIDQDVKLIVIDRQHKISVEEHELVGARN